MVVRLVPTTRRRCRPERGVDHVARRSNELGVERVQPAAFAPADCSPCPGLPAFAPAQSRVHFVRTVHGNNTGIGDITGGCNARSVVVLRQRPLIDFYVLVWPELGWSRGVRACYPVWGDRSRSNRERGGKGPVMSCGQNGGSRPTKPGASYDGVHKSRWKTRHLPLIWVAWRGF